MNIYKWGRYRASPPTLGEGEDDSPELDVNGNLKVTLATTIAGEDTLNNVIRVEGQFLPLLVATSTQVKGAPGFIHTLTLSCNDAAPTAGSLIVYNSLSASGTQVFNHTFTTTPFVPTSIILDAIMSIGIYASFTTTADVNCTITYR